MKHHPYHSQPHQCPPASGVRRGGGGNERIMGKQQPIKLQDMKAADECEVRVRLSVMGRRGDQGRILGKQQPIRLQDIKAANEIAHKLPSPSLFNASI